MMPSARFTRPPQTRVELRQRLLRARTLIDARYQEALDLDQIARHAHFSRYYFIRLFRLAYGETPHQYLTRRRIEKAKELLAAGELTVTEVCLAVGFQSLGSFSALFTRLVGQPPQRYRAQMVARRRFIPACFLRMAGLLPEPGDPRAGPPPG
jgi:AraC-like DNA-binding protein